VAEASVRFASPAHIGDPLEIDISTEDVRTRAWTWKFAIRDSRDGRLVAEGKTVQVYYDYQERRSMAIPDDVRTLLESGRE
jgi:acyl-CoA thioester hydrolase